MILKLSKSVLAITLCVVMTACPLAQWIQVALADLPILVQMGINIAQLVSTVQGTPVSQEQIEAINNLSNEAKTDLQLLLKLYNEYKANPSASKMQEIEAVISTINTNLPALLTAAHIKDPVLAGRVSAAIGLILNTVTTIAALIPSPTNPAVVAMKNKVGAKPTVPTPNELKAAWNAQVYPQF